MRVSTATAALVPLLVLAVGCGDAAQQPTRTVVQQRTATQTRTVTVPTPASRPTPAPEAAPLRYLAQLGSFRSRTNADGFAADLRAHGLRAAVMRSDAYVEMQPDYWVVYLGFFEDLGAAKAAATQAHASGSPDAFARQVTYDVTR